MTCLPNNYMDAHIIFGVNSVLNDNTCAPSIDALRTTHGDNSVIKLIYSGLPVVVSTAGVSNCCSRSTTTFAIALVFVAFPAQLQFTHHTKNFYFEIYKGNQNKNKVAIFGKDTTEKQLQIGKSVISSISAATSLGCI